MHVLEKIYWNTAFYPLFESLFLSDNEANF